MVEILKESTEKSTDELKTITLKARDYDNNLEKMLDCIKDLSTAGHSFQVVVDPDAENPNERTFGIDGDGCDQLVDIDIENSKDDEDKIELDESMLVEDNDGIKVKMSQKLVFDYNTDVEQYSDDNDFILDNIEIDDQEIARALLKYFSEYNYNDEFKEVYNLVTRVDVDFENDSITVYLTIKDTSITDEKIKYVFEDFIKDVVLEDDQLNSSTTISVEPFQSEPYESGFNGITDEISYDTTTIDEIDVSYEFTTYGEQTLEIKR